MSEVTELEKELEELKKKNLKEKYDIEDELDQLKKDKFDYRRKGDFPAIEKANIREKELKDKLISLNTAERDLVAKIEKAKIEKDKIKGQSDYQETRNQMNSIITQMYKGKNRLQAANYVGVPISKVNEWCRKGLNNNDAMYVNFYKRIHAIEIKQNNERKSDTSKDNQKDSTNMINCPHCGRKINKVNEKCPYCNKYKDSSKLVPNTESQALSKVRYCINCGKKLDKLDSNYCSNCGASLKTGAKHNNKKTTFESTPSKESSDDWIRCCIAIILIFIIFGFILSFI